MNGKLLKEKRTELRYTVTKLAQLSGVARQTISEIENGKVTNPKISTIQSICEVLEVSPAIFLTAS